MAKIRGPLMSYAASGTVAGIITHRNTARGQQASRPGASSKPPSAYQVEQRTRFSAAAASWAAASPTVRAMWGAAALYHSIPPRPLYIKEWLLQQSTADHPPLVPAQNF